MKINDLQLPRPSIDFLASQGYDELYPPQADSVRAGLLDGKSLLVSAPTASGKTLVATMAILGHLADRQRRIVYLSPLKALASEKHAELKRITEIPGLEGTRVRISTGDLDAKDAAALGGDVVVMTNEKMDSAMRHDPGLAEEIGLIIIDEVHLLGDDSRGPTLEMVLSRFRQAERKPQIVALSATVSNANEIAGWLGIGLVENDWRPVPLTEGVYDEGEVTMQDGRTFEVPLSLRSPPVDIGLDSVMNGGQSLIFAPTRPRSVSLASKAAQAVHSTMSKSGIKHLEGVSAEILERNENTKLVKTLAELVRHGVAFHHAGLNQHCRETVEREFRGGSIRLLASTPTLAAGVNLPARRVVIASIMRYDPRAGGSAPISVMEYKQFCGRAGRPQYDDFGEAIILPGSLPARDVTDIYVNGEPEPIRSAIGSQRSLRIHVLSLIASTPGIMGDGICDFFLGTLGGTQSDPGEVRDGVGRALETLRDGGFIVGKGGRYAATKLGKRVSLLYIDPDTATGFLEALDMATPEGRHTLGFLHLISECGEFYPKLGMRNSDYEIAGGVIEEHATEGLSPLTEYDCNRSLIALHCWISEKTDIFLSERLGVESGDMHRMVESAAWLAYSLRELARVSGRAGLIDELGLLRRRIAYGIREELIELVSVKGIGRVRARSLFDHRVRNRASLAKIPVARLAKIDKIGTATAARIKSQIGGAR